MLKSSNYFFEVKYLIKSSFNNSVVTSWKSFRSVEWKAACDKIHTVKQLIWIQLICDEYYKM